MLQNTTFISANYDIHIDNAIASLYDANKFPVMLNYGIDFTNFNMRQKFMAKTDRTYDKFI